MTTSDPAARTATACEWFAALTDRGGLQRMQAMSLPDTIIHHLGETFADNAASLRAVAAHNDDALANTRARTDDGLADNTHCAFQWQFVCRRTGQPYEPRCCGTAWFRFVDERIAEVWVYWEPQSQFAAFDKTAALRG